MEEPQFSIPSFAKINWFLKVGGRRVDGFHEICTAFQTISLFDTLNFRPSGDLELTCSDPALPLGDDNLVIKAAKLLKEKAGVQGGAAIHIEKRIPFPGGLGGGSSNAAVALLGLSVLWGLDLSAEDLLEMASALGSDVPFFFFGGTALGTGRGTDLEPLPDVFERALVLIAPDVHIPTGPAFELLARPGLTKDSPDFILNVCRNLAEKLVSGRPELVNDFESTAFRLAPEVERAHSELRAAGASDVLLAGSGASVFGIFENDSLRDEAVSVLEQREGIRVFAVRTVSRAEYTEALGACGHQLQKFIG
jgi:4-diphosphocytidyl-2-C-methyl-D-erythritol kinase